MQEEQAEVHWRPPDAWDQCAKKRIACDRGNTEVSGTQKGLLDVQADCVRTERTATSRSDSGSTIGSVSEWTSETSISPVSPFHQFGIASQSLFCDSPIIDDLSMNCASSDLGQRVAPLERMDASTNGSATLRETYSELRMALETAPNTHQKQLIDKLVNLFSKLNIVRFIAFMDTSASRWNVNVASLLKLLSAIIRSYFQEMRVGSNKLWSLP